MKICTFNVNSIRVRKDLIVEWLNHRNQDIDILCFQELKSVIEQFPYQDFERLDFACEVFGQKAYNGVAICSRHPMRNVRKGFQSSLWDEQKRLITCEVGEFALINVYAPHGGLKGEQKYAYKKEWYEKLLSFLEDNYSPRDPLLIAGDFNIARGDKDVYDPEALKDTIGTMPEERAAFENLINWGLIDGFRHLHPDLIQFTWWDYIGGAVWKNQGMRIDYFLHTEPLKDKVKMIEVDIWPRRRRTPKPSDHAPVVVTLDSSEKKD